MLTAFVVATVLIALAELGDKTQLLALCLAARYDPWKVLVGITGATLLIHLLSTAVGEAAGGIIPAFWLRLLTGALFVGFGVWTLRGEADAGSDTSDGRFGPVVASGVAFFLAEFGDKTQIMTMTVAADPGAALRSLGILGSHIPPSAAPTKAAAFVGVWLGSTVGMVLADGLAIVVGAVLGKKLPERLITRVAGAFFILFGVASLLSAFLVNA